MQAQTKICLMSKKPFFSIIIPTLNEEIVLPRLLKDIQHQTFKNFEVTVVDAKSSDKTIKRASTFQNKVPNFKIITAPKKGVGFQRNLGAKHSKAKWLLFFDADIKIPPHFLKSIRKKLESRTPRGAGPTDYFTAWTGPDKKRAQEQIIVAFLNLVIEIAHLIEKPAAFGSMLGWFHFEILGH